MIQNIRPPFVIRDVNNEIRAAIEDDEKVEDYRDVPHVAGVDHHGFD